MTDPRKDLRAQNYEEQRKLTYEKYEPIVLWVKSGRFMVDETRKGMYPTESIIKSMIKENVGFDDFIDIAENEPEIESIITEFDND